MAIKCPRCGLYNPEEAERCDCGYDFASGQVKSSYLTANAAGSAGAYSSTPAPRSIRAILFSFEGRITRLTFWLVVILLGLVLVTQAGGKNPPFAVIVLVFPPAMWISIAVQGKRWHDRNKSAWMILINALPLVGFVWVVIELGCLRGTRGPNRFGADPLER